ncbi:MAG TPA: DUF998 domain-containing protein [Luteimonas sp.]|nr:DUF998 domain-containing protein [Luteimonas sp.]
MEEKSTRPMAQTRSAATIAIAGLAFFCAVAIAVQFLRTDLDWRLAPMSFYLLGAYGYWLQAAYFALAGALVMIAYAYYSALSPQARSGAPALMFVLAAVGLCTTAVADSNSLQRAPTLEGWVHGTSAQAAFLFVTTAMLLQAWRLRGDPAWRARFALAFGWAAVCFAAVWLLSFWRELPRGLAQKAVIALIVGWLALSAAWLKRGASRA